MKELILTALKAALEKVNSFEYKTKFKGVQVRIDHIPPMELPQFMLDNEIPADADYMVGMDSSERATGEIFLEYTKVVGTTLEEKRQYRIKRFNKGWAWKKVYEALTNNGYKAVGCDTRLLKQFDNTTIYNMFIEKEYDRLVEYYSLRFKKVD
jgi:hypothetical protein